MFGSVVGGDWGKGKCIDTVSVCVSVCVLGHSQRKWHCSFQSLWRLGRDVSIVRGRQEVRGSGIVRFSRCGDWEETCL